MSNSQDDIANIHLPFTIINHWTTTLTIPEIESSFIAASYNNPNGNDPIKYSNNLFVWAGDSNAPWNSPAVAATPASKGSTSISGNYDAETYLVGYSVGPSVTINQTPTYPNLCATALIPADWNLNNVTYFSPSLGINTVYTQLITFNYALPDGFNPTAANSWIGLWSGKVNPYNNTQQLSASAQIKMTTSTGTAAMTGLGLAPNSTYTAALFTSGYSTNPGNLSLTPIAVIVQFLLS